MGAPAEKVKEYASSAAEHVKDTASSVAYGINPFNIIKDPTRLASGPFNEYKRQAGKDFHQVKELTGLAETPEQTAQRLAAEEETARASAYNDSLSGGIDKLSQKQIADLYASGASSSAIASVLQGARSGKGIYAVRSINQNQQEYMKNNPGRKQTTHSLGYGSVL